MGKFELSLGFIDFTENAGTEIPTLQPGQCL